MELFSSWLPVIAVIVLSVFVETADSEFVLTVLHTNDIHARIQEVDKYIGDCSAKDAAKKHCFGGYARIKTKVDEIRSQSKNTILVDGGDQYMGSLWFYLYGGEVMSHFMNLVGYDAMALGNHEFDKGARGLKPFLDNVTFPVLSCNIDTSETPELGSVMNSTILKVGGELIGVVGYTTDDTPLISNPGQVKFSDEIESIRAEVERLTNCLGIDKIIAVGHAGYAKDKEIAEKVVGVDVVVGGHTNTFLYSGNAPDKDDPVGNYPTVVTNSKGDTVLVVQDYAFGKYLGKLDVTFDDCGKVISYGGNPILLDYKVPKDAGVLAVINSYLPDINKRRHENIGRSLVFLEGDRSACRFHECNMGNVITDAMVHENLRYSDGRYWSEQVTIALINGGGIRANIQQGQVTVADVINVQPFSNSVDIIQITGQTIWDMLEHSAANRDSDEEGFDGFGGYLQMSGLRVVYDQTQPKNHRVVQVQALCSDCFIPEFKPLNLTGHYMVLMQEYLIKGKTGFSLDGKILLTHTIGALDSTILMGYISKTSPLITGLEGRIRFIENANPKPPPPAIGAL